jgi:ABC-type sugar transport system substrate-binding protein
MAGQTKSRTKPAWPALTYRGVKLQRSAVPSQFTREQIVKAIEDAIAKNPDAFVRQN